ncbi:hypothetical protein FACS1894147_04710 [Spirochaetia bacterium]|nr:hypothetical protein FACS1894147_04710 [Spirochaetia bacterium]
MIDYILKPNTLKAPGAPAPTGFHAQTVQSEERTTADFISIMADTKGGATKGEAAQWLDVVRRTLISELARGSNVNLKGLFSANVNIKGPFPASDSSFDPARNKLHVGISVSRAITKEIKDSATRHVSEASSGIFIGHVQDAASGTEDSVLTPGMVCRVRGSKIKIAGDAPTVGVAFLGAGGEETLIARTAISHNGVNEIDFVIPNLAHGAYRVRVTTMYAGSGIQLASPRSYTFPAPLTVATPA